MFRIVIFFITLFYSLQQAYACFDLSMIFNNATYIEIDDIHLGHTNYLEPDRQFGIIFQNMQPLASEQPPIDDDGEFRQLSRKSEPENYAIYAQAANQFENQHYQEALAKFIKLRESINDNKSWVKEASTFMIGRCQRNLAAVKWDGYSDPITNIDQLMLKNAKSNYDKYLKDYPHGLYVNSARNIQRNLMRFSGDQVNLDNAIKQLISVKENLNNIDNVNELRNYFNGKINLETDTPILIVYDIIYNKTHELNTIKMLDQRQAEFQEYPDVLRFLKALTLYRLKNYQGILDQVPEGSIINTPLSLSIAYLRAQAQIHLNQEKNALSTLLKMYAVSPQDATLKHIGSLEINNGHGLWLFTNKIAIQNRTALQAFAKYGLSDDELKAGLTQSDILPSERLILAEELANRYLLSKNFKNLNQLLIRYSELPNFNMIKSDVSTLSYHPKDVQANLSVGAFIYENYSHPDINNDQPYFGYQYDLSELEECKLCQLFTDRIKNYTPPIAYFNYAFNSIKKLDYPDEVEARVLHYLIKCKKHVECHERCTWGRQNVDYDGEKYFKLLHLKYKNSKWAKVTPYWYQS